MLMQLDVFCEHAVANPFYTDLITKIALPDSWFYCSYTTLVFTAFK